jgi:hypothetical protein
METYSSETSLDFQRTTQPHIPEGITFNKDSCENLILQRIIWRLSDMLELASVVLISYTVYKGTINYHILCL